MRRSQAGLHVRRTHHRPVATAGIVACLALAIALVAPTTTYADDAPDMCPAAGSMPRVGAVSPDTMFFDSNVAVWVGGDFTMDPRFAETEGLNVIEGSLYIQSTNRVNIGVVGVGSGIVPPDDAVMLAVGGDVVIADGSSAIIAGLGVTGRADIGGTVTSMGVGTLEAVRPDPLNPGTLHDSDTDGIRTEYADALLSWAGFGDAAAAASSYLASLEPTGSYTAEPWAGTFEVTDSTADLQVFNINAGDLENVYGTLLFSNLPTDSTGAFVPVVVNVFGENPVLEHTHVEINGTRVDLVGYPTSPMGEAASAILWNFVDAQTLSVPGSSQVIGSIVAPLAETTTIEASTNGRLYVGGDLIRSGEGTEHHNYPWQGFTQFACMAAAEEVLDEAVGFFTVVKVVEGEAADLVPDDTEFVIEFSVEDDEGNEVTTDVTGAALPSYLVVTADGTPVDGPLLHAGHVVTLREVNLPAIPGVDWGQPVLTPETLVIGSDNSLADVVVTNTAVVQGEEEPGEEEPGDDEPGGGGQTEPGDDDPGGGQTDPGDDGPGSDDPGPTGDETGDDTGDDAGDDTPDNKTDNKTPDTKSDDTRSDDGKTDDNSGQHEDGGGNDDSGQPGGPGPDDTKMNLSDLTDDGLTDDGLSDDDGSNADDQGTTHEDDSTSGSNPSIVNAPRGSGPSTGSLSTNSTGPVSTYTSLPRTGLDTACVMMAWAVLPMAVMGWCLVREWAKASRPRCRP